jgi:hypothetical protein
MLNRGVCLACRQRAGSASRTSVRSCACGWTASYCRRDGGLARCRREVAEHAATCVTAHIRAKLEARFARIPTVVVS